ncbi:MAG: TetR/AcrR family transcriptional regulator [Pseudomonadales bacterium]|nr:TetR/AcrR family transcriptional regulator [Pseudomonadales bacterium]
MARKPRIQPPRQDRSRATLERILEAATALLETQVWDDIAISAIARRAQSSIGSFYARFADKNALLDHLDERYAAELTDLLEAHMKEARAAAWSLEERAGHLLQALITYHRTRRGLLRTLVLTARAGNSSRYRARSQRINAALPVLVENFKQCGELHGPDLDARLHHALTFTFSALRDQLLFPESMPNPYSRTDAELAEALSRNFLGYLAYKPESGR